MSIKQTPPVELVAPDISRWRQGNTGVDWVTSFDSGVPGPHVLICAVTHGNEICGAIALDRLLKMGIRPTRGKLTLAFNNVDAYLRFDPAEPHKTRFVDEDFNRVWSPATLDGERDSVELRRARALRPIVDQADLLLDIHSMHDPHGPVMICGPLSKGIEFARRVAIPATIVSDKGHANGTRMRDYGGFGDPASAKNALLVECGQHWEQAAADIAWRCVWRFLRDCDVVSAAQADAESGAVDLQALRVVHVTEAIIAQSANFKFAPGLKGLSLLPHKGDLIGHDGDVPVVTPYDNCVLIMPTLVHVKPGLTVVRIGRVES